MAYIETTTPGDAQGEVRAMYERQQAAYGYVPNYAKVFCHRPEIMKLWADLQYGIRKHIDKRRFELVTVAAAHAMKSSYCSLAHGKTLTKFFSADEVRAIVDEDGGGPLSDTEIAMMRLARKVVRDASSVTDEDFTTLRDHGISDGEIFDIVATAAARSFFAKLVEGLGAAADVAYLDVEQGLRDVLVVGRPIDPSAPELLPA